MSGIGCPLCGSVGWRRVLAGPGFTVVRCQACGLARTEPLPRDDGDPGSDNGAFYERIYREQREFRYALAGAMLEAVLAFGAPGRLLDIGCGMGFFLDLATRRGYACLGIDRSPAATRFARERFKLDVWTGDFIQADVGVETFDVVTMNHVLEHVTTPIAFLEKVRKALKPGGTVISSSPNFGGALPRILGGRWNGLQPTEHVWHFTPITYGAAFTRAGFAVAQVQVGSLRYAPGPGWKTTLVFWLARLSTAVGRGDNLVLVGRAT